MNKILILFLLLSSTLLLSLDTFYYSNTKKKSLTPLTVSKSILRTSTVKIAQKIDYYLTELNATVGVTDKLVVKFHSLEQYKDILNKYNLLEIKKLYKNTYLLQSQSPSTTIQIANELYILDSVKYAHPNFIKKAIKR